MVKSTVDGVAHAIASAPRRRLVGRLAEGPATMSELAEVLGITLPAIDKHVRVLEAAGLARKRRVGRQAIVTLEAGGLDLLADWATGMRAMWRARLSDFADHLQEEQP
ncbi:metalloregulator ArsR/SmtB family transcription factor [Agrococcus sp. ARC_14]|uniref:ArsR/SmtB family transcription factor n=1 Tax=Agrococcus sp. ARC_14 TaxID=2919927 RepID=UPI001F05212B|nr:metalloregulator ArsR/SmtB family transcription factor [Agrococcus sp. ARC_14]MCH1882206.1 helix-turn-helix domain-containing protein [Agrococcus sp. ARC_14]